MSEMMHLERPPQENGPWRQLVYTGASDMALTGGEQTSPRRPQAGGDLSRMNGMSANVSALLSPRAKTGVQPSSTHQLMSMISPRGALPHVMQPQLTNQAYTLRPVATAGGSSSVRGGATGVVVGAGKAPACPAIAAVGAAQYDTPHVLSPRMLADMQKQIDAQVLASAFAAPVRLGPCSCRASLAAQ